MFHPISLWQQLSDPFINYESAFPNPARWRESDSADSAAPQFKEVNAWRGGSLVFIQIRNIRLKTDYFFLAGDIFSKSFWFRLELKECKDSLSICSKQNNNFSFSITTRSPRLQVARSCITATACLIDLFVFRANKTRACRLIFPENSSRPATQGAESPQPSGLFSTRVRWVGSVIFSKRPSRVMRKY